MKRWTLPLLSALCFLSAPALSGCSEEPKPPAVAGSFYPADAEGLRTAVDAYLAAADTPLDRSGRLIALIAPHAGYQYSGQVAAHSYRHLAEREVGTVVLIGASHFAPVRGAAVYAGGAWETPLGKVKINSSAARSLLNEANEVVENREAFSKEHSLEVQLPFLQRTLKDFTIVPILIGAPTQASFRHLAERLTALLRRDPKAIIVTSTDLSHYHDQATAVGKDRKVLDAVTRMSVEDAERLLVSGDGEMCGGYPALLTMMVARDLGATNGVLYRSATSGDVTGEKDRVVGYAAVGLYRSPLTGAQKQALLALAKQTVHAHVNRKSLPDPAIADSRLLANGATFVTLNRGHMLRGCIGNMQPHLPLYRSVIQNAVSASSKDPRFPPVTPAELDGLDVEVTVLSPLEPLADVKDLKVGTHGLLLVKGAYSGVLLPQVPVEQGWDEKTFLEQVSVKAGLPKEAWKDPETKLSIFTAEIIK